MFARLRALRKSIADDARVPPFVIFGDTALQQMGMQLMEPPDVKGWRYGRQWIDSQRLFTRYNAVASLIESNKKQKDYVAAMRASDAERNRIAAELLRTKQEEAIEDALEAFQNVNIPAAETAIAEAKNA